MGRAVRGVIAGVYFVALCGCKESTPKSREERAADALARVEQIVAVVPELRRLSLDRPIPALRQSGADFRARVHQSVAETPHLDHRAIALQALGLIESKTDLARSIENVYVSQAAAYYDPRTKAFSLVMAPQNELVFDSVSAHEITHGLQDQHFDLTTYLAGTKEAPLNADEQIARRFISEGDAMFTSIIYVAYTKTNEKELTGAQVTAMRRELGKLDALDGPALAAALRQQMSTAKIVDEEIQRSLDAMPTIPAAIMEPFLLPYMKGASVVAEAYERGGWTAVNKLYTDPPRSTAQVLHPREQLFQARHEPRAVFLPKFDAKRIELLESDVLGELMWSIYFRRWKYSGEAHPEAGWNGDRFEVWRDANGKIVVLISTVWETSYHAKEFYDAYVSTLDARYPDQRRGEGEQVRDRTWIRLVKDRVLIVDGSATNLLDDLEHPSAR